MRPSAVIFLACFSLLLVRTKLCAPINHIFKYTTETKASFKHLWGRSDIAVDVKPIRHATSVRSVSANSGVQERPPFWQDAVVPYEIATQNYTSAELRQIEMAISEMNKNKTCVEFRQRAPEDDSFVYITKSGGCWSSVGDAGKPYQTVSIDSNCAEYGIIMHELMHTLGFWHEHTRPDRDRYVRVLWDHIVDGHKIDFNVNVLANTSLEYDFDSILHYRSNEFSINHTLSTLEPLSSSVDISALGQRQYLSQGDFMKIRYSYECDMNRACREPCQTPDNSLENKTHAVRSDISYSLQCSKSGKTCIGPEKRTCLYNRIWSGAETLVLSSSSYGDFSYCNFEDDWCGFTNDTSTTGLKFIRHQGQTPTDHTGPIFDHTISHFSGHYVYMEGSRYDWNEATDGSYAVITSQDFSFSIRPCLLFFYNMNGRDIGSLHITVYATDDSSILLSDSVANSQGPDWQMYHKRISVAPNRSFHIKLKAVRGNGVDSDIAIDDVIVGNCDVTDMYDQVSRDNTNCTTAATSETVSASLSVDSDISSLRSRGRIRGRIHFKK